MYWSEPENRLCELWINCETEDCYAKVYRKLAPKIKRMAQAIMMRYYSGNVNMSKQVEYNLELLDHTLINLHKYDVSKSGPNGWYSFIQTMIKNYCFKLFSLGQYDTVINQHRKNTKSFSDKFNDDGDELDPVDPCDESEAAEIEELKTLVINKLENRLLYDVNTEKSKLFYMRVIKFFKEHDNFSNVDLGYWMMNNYDYTQREVENLFKKELQILIRVHKTDPKDRRQHKKIKNSGYSEIIGF